MRGFIIVLLALLPCAPAFAAPDTGAMPGYLVLREGDAATPLAYNKMKVYFEWENNDYAYGSDWPSEGAFLVMLPEEPEKHGVFQEDMLFGDMERGYGGELSVKDGNNNGLLDAEDSAWPRLALWTDKNSDGYPQTDEVEKLSADPDASFDRAKGVLSYNGKTFAAHAFLPFYDKINSRFTGEYTLDIATLFLPTLRGYSTIPDLHVAASKDASLKAILLKMCQKPVKEVFSAQYLKRFDGEFGDLMYKWMGVDGVDPKSRGPYIDGRRLAAIEILMGREFSGYKNATGPERTRDPNNAAARTLENIWSIWAGAAYSKIVAQCMRDQLFVPPLKYDLAKDAVAFDDTIATLQTRANIDSLLATMNPMEQDTFWLTLEDFFKTLEAPKVGGAQRLIAVLKGPPSMVTEKPRATTKASQH